MHYKQKLGRKWIPVNWRISWWFIWKFTGSYQKTQPTSKATPRPKIMPTYKYWYGVRRWSCLRKLCVQSLNSPLTKQWNCITTISSIICPIWTYFIRTKLKLKTYFCRRRNWILFLVIKVIRSSCISTTFMTMCQPIASKIVILWPPISIFIIT